MKYRLLILILASLSLLACSQKSLPTYESYFSAMIVSDIDTSLTWYTNSLRCSLLNKTESQERGFKQANLRCGESLLELIELDRAVSPELIPDYDTKSRIIGIFKTGYRVSGFDEWLAHLKDLKVSFHGEPVMDKQGKRMLIVLDPDGNRIQLFEA